MVGLFKLLAIYNAKLIVIHLRIKRKIYDNFTFQVDLTFKLSDIQKLRKAFLMKHNYTYGTNNLRFFIVKRSLFIGVVSAWYCMTTQHKNAAKPYRTYKLITSDMVGKRN